VSPAEVYRLSLADFLTWERQAVRIMLAREAAEGSS
jgi:hypothetical protein